MARITIGIYAVILVMGICEVAKGDAANNTTNAEDIQGDTGGRPVDGPARISENAIPLTKLPPAVTTATGEEDEEVDDDGTAEASIFTSHKQEFKKLLGEEVTIKCSVKPGASPVMWQNGSDIMSMNRDLFGDPNPRVTIEGAGTDFNLHIRNLDLTDEGTYSCQVPRRGKQANKLVVNIPPSVIMTPNQASIEENLGDSVAFRCHADGKPDPKVTWFREGSKLPSGDEKFEGETFTLENLGKGDSGTYKCKASNGFGNDVVKPIRLDVRYPPSVSVEETLLYLAPGDDISIQCSFSASPDASVMWKHDGNDINFSQRQNLKTSDKKNGEKTVWTLEFDGLKKEDYGVYRCQGGNNKGMTYADVKLSGLPYKVEVLSDAVGQFSNQYTLEWSVKSKVLPIEYNLMVQALAEVNGSAMATMNNTVPAPLIAVKPHTYEGVYTLKDTRPNTTYHVQIRCRNTFGYSEWSDKFEFVTAQEGQTAPPPTTTTRKPSTPAPTLPPSTTVDTSQIKVSTEPATPSETVTATTAESAESSEEDASTPDSEESVEEEKDGNEGNGVAASVLSSSQVLAIATCMVTYVMTYMLHL